MFTKPHGFTKPYLFIYLFSHLLFSLWKAAVQRLLLEEIFYFPNGKILQVPSNLQLVQLSWQPQVCMQLPQEDTHLRREGVGGRGMGREQDKTYAPEKEKK